MQKLKEQVLKANLDLPRYGLVTFTWGNVSGIDREQGIIVIKPSGVEYDHMGIDDLVVVDMKGNVVEGNYKPSSDTATHIEIYKAFPDVYGIVHTHSSYATAFAQACEPIAAYGTTHADYFYGEIPCTRILTNEEVTSNYEYNTGKVIVETFADKNPDSIPGVVVANHGPFAWGKSPDYAVYHAVVMEEVAKMAIITRLISPEVKSVNKYILDKHYLRKHGKDSYYGQ